MKKPIKDINKFRRSFLINALRKQGYMWPPSGEAFKAARVGRGLYQCNLCKQVFKPKEVVRDHVQPVQSVQGFAAEPGSPLDLGTTVLRMLPQAAGYQILCRPCHATKSTYENSIRKEARRSKKSQPLHKR